MTEFAPPEPCSACHKPAHLCICEAVVPIDTRLKVLVLQHPQEKREVLGTAGMVAQIFPRADLKIGLSWPGLRRIVGEGADATRWGVLYLGPVKAGGPPRDEIAAVDKNGAALKDSADVLARLDGIILLDGTWSQAKTLWWRNAWLLKCRRIVLNPKAKSLYGQARREPRRDSLSTLEAAAYLLSRLEGRPEIWDTALAPFALLLKKLRTRRPRPTSPASPVEAVAEPAASTPEPATE